MPEDLHSVPVLLSVMRFIAKLTQRATGDNDPHEPTLINLLPVVAQVAIKHLTLPDSSDLVAECLTCFGNLIFVPPNLQTTDDLDLAIIMLPVINRLILPSTTPSTSPSNLVEPACKCLVQILRRAGSSPIVWAPFYRKLMSLGIKKLHLHQFGFGLIH